LKKHGFVGIVLSGEIRCSSIAHLGTSPVGLLGRIGRCSKTGCQSTRHTVNSSQPKIVWRVDRRLKHRVVTSWPAVLSLLWRV